MINFELVPASEWQLDLKVSADRRDRLLTTPFDAIVARIGRQVTVANYYCELGQKVSSAKRLHALLVLPSSAIDLFHNGAGGYRAQYYLGMDQGKAANVYLVNSLIGRMREVSACQPVDHCEWEFIEASLAHPDAKCWIYEGPWLSNEPDLWNLRVDRWDRNAHKITMAYRFEAGWARLTPEYETRLELKGGWVDGWGRPAEKQPKSRLHRSSEIHHHGYT